MVRLSAGVRSALRTEASQTDLSGALSPAAKQPEREKMTRNFHLVPRLGMHIAIPTDPLLLSLQYDAQKCNNY